MGIIWSYFAASIKRYHDRSKNGWWALVGLIPYIGAIWQIIELGCLEGTIGQNEYGPDPIDRSSENNIQAVTNIKDTKDTTSGY